MAPPPALASVAVATPTLVERAIDDILAALENAQGDRVVLESGQVPTLIVGPRKCALMAGPLSGKAVRHITEHLLPRDYLEALDEIGGARYQWPGFVVLATDDGDHLALEIKRSKH